MYSSDNLGNSSEAEEQHHQQVRKMMSMVAFTMANIVVTTALNYTDPLYNMLPYHTSALSGADWVQELISGHPECIRNELGVHKHVFHALMEEMQHVYLEEQLTIFLYTCVTGLSLWHVCECFQHLGDTVSEYVFYIHLILFNI